ncbi:CTP synthase [Candidatus Woesearchaeota archaeon]|nr:CTP synthase [Candidatus Woesearchaeota archaeon]
MSSTGTRSTEKARYIIVTGGVLSGLGKGIITASIGNVLVSHGYRVSPVKIDPYINIDAGTMRPTEHGEVWVTPDGGETDQDLGNYERFMDIDIDKDHNITTGQVYLTVIQKERNLEYDGKNVEVIPHIPQEVQKRISTIAERESSDFVLVEIGGTVGDYQSVLFLEAARQMKLEGKEVVFVHVVYLPIPGNVGEMKTKPAQHSVRELNAAGIQPDFIVARSSVPVDEVRKEKLSLFCNVAKDSVISAPDLTSIYQSPVRLEEQDFVRKILKKFGLNYGRSPMLEKWKRFVKNIDKCEDEVRIGIIGKYFDIGDFSLEDSYISVIEAVKHACWSSSAKPKISWIDSKCYEKESARLKELSSYDGIIIPGGFGSSGVEGKIAAIRYARENNIPFLGLCYGLQLAVVEYARDVCGLKGANTTEIDKKAAYPVIDILPEQKKNIEASNYGATMRLGACPAILREGTIVRKLYGKKEITERHRHRYEVNPDYIELLEKNGLVFSGRSPDRRLMEYIELPGHSFFCATQAHPEFSSRPMKPNPMFNGFIKACLKR